MDDHELARRLVLEASERLPQSPLLATDGGPTQTELLAEALLTHRPDDGVLGDRLDDDERPRHCRVWLIDAAGAMAGAQDDASVGVARSEQGEVTTGALALLDRCLVVGTTSVDRGLACDVPSSAASEHPRDEPSNAAGHADELLSEAVHHYMPIGTIGVEAVRPSPAAYRLARATGARLVPSASNNASAARVLLGETDVHVQEDDEDEWHSAPAVAVARAIGLHVSHLDGSVPRYNKIHPIIPSLICRSAVADAVLAQIAD